MKNHINILIAGGSGLWAEKNHYPAILALKSEDMPVKVVAICDPVNPHKTEKKETRFNLKRILKIDKPLWINPIGKTSKQLIAELNQIHKESPLIAVIVSTEPIWHYFYCKWAVDNKINLLCDKPIIATPNSSFDLEQAKLIQRRFDEICSLYYANKKSEPSYIICSPLRRRALTPFVKIATELSKVYLMTGEGIRYMNVIINGGVHKYPSEYIKGGAHGHLGGIGTLSHSSYHYIDVIAWYLKIAKGNINNIELSLTHILRVKEYLKTKAYQRLRKLIEEESEDFNDDVSVPDEVLNTELDFSFYLKLKDDDNNQVGLITFIVNYSTYAPRLTKYDPEVTEYAHDKYGGRMSSVYYDIHQGAIQQWQLIKNDEVAFGHNIDLRQYLHPRLGKKVKKMFYKDAYEEGTITSKDLFKSFIKMCIGKKVNKKQAAMLSIIDDQRLTHRLYSLMYEKIAEDFHDKYDPINSTRINLIIDLEDYI